MARLFFGCCVVLWCTALGAQDTDQSLPRWDANLAERQGVDSAMTTAWEGTPVPKWLHRLALHNQKHDQVRDALQTVIQVDFKKTQLEIALQDIAQQAGFQLGIHAAELDLIGLHSDDTISFGPAGGTAQQLLRQILDPIELTYVSGPQGILVTSQDAADSTPVHRYYDLTWVLPTGSQAKSLVDAVELTIDPDSWLAVGGTSRIQLVGSIMVVAAPDSTQSKIEEMLANLHRLRARAGESESQDAAEQPPKDAN